MVRVILATFCACLLVQFTFADTADPNNATVEEQVAQRKAIASFYVVTWPAGGNTDTIEVNTVDLYLTGTITISNFEDTDSGDPHVHGDKDVNPTTDKLEPSVERLTLSDKEKKWAATGKIRVRVFNTTGTGPGPSNVRPKVLSVVRKPSK